MVLFLQISQVRSRENVLFNLCLFMKTSEKLWNSALTNFRTSSKIAKIMAYIVLCLGILLNLVFVAFFMSHNANNS